MPTVKLTEAFIRTQLICRNGKRTEYCAEQFPGFLVEVRRTSPGQGTYYLRVKMDGKTRYRKLGTVSTTSLSDAMKLGRKLKSEFELQGKDIKKDDHSDMPSLTYDEFMQDYYFPYVKTHKKSWKGDIGMYNSRIEPKFGKCLLSDMNRLSVQQFHIELKELGLANSTCNHFVKMMRASLNRAVEWQFLQINPISKLRMYKEDGATRFLNQTEIERLTHVLMSHDNRMVCEMLLYVLATASRISEAYNAKWDFVDIDDRKLIIPANMSKSGRIRTVILNDVALGVLERVGTKDKYEYIFVNTRTGTKFTTIQKTWERIRKIANLDDVPIHCLRHTAASIMLGQNRSLVEIRDILGHQDIKMATRYAHLEKSTLHSASDSISNQINEALKKVS